MYLDSGDSGALRMLAQPPDIPTHTLVKHPPPSSTPLHLTITEREHINL